MTHRNVVLGLDALMKLNNSNIVDIWGMLAMTTWKMIVKKQGSW